MPKNERQSGYLFNLLRYQKLMLHVCPLVFQEKNVFINEHSHENVDFLDHKMEITFELSST